MRTDRRFSSDNLRAALWAYRAAHMIRRRLKEDGLDADLRLPGVPFVGRAAERGVKGSLRRMGETCLVKALVMQRWKAAFGEKADLIVGVTAPKLGFKAHAWLEGEPPCHDEGFSELVRLDG